MEYELMIKVKCNVSVIDLICDDIMSKYPEIWQITIREDKTKIKIRG